MEDFLGDIETGLISSWFLDEESGTNAWDHVDGNHLSEANGNGIPSSSPIINLGKGRVFGGNAANQGLVITDASQSNLGGEYFNTQDGLSILAWVNHNAFGQDRAIVVKGTDSTDDEYDLRYDIGTNKWEFKVTTGGGAQTLVRTDNFNTVHGPPTSGVWYMLYAEWDRTNQKIRIEANASGINTTNFTGTLNNSNKDFKIGAHQPGAGVNIFDGTITFVGVWNRPLTINERVQLFNENLGLEVPFQNFSNGGNQGIGGFIESRTSTGANLFEQFGGYLFAPKQFGPGDTAGIKPQFGGYLFSPKSFGPDGFGGYLFAKARLDQRNNDFFGGYIKAPGSEKGDTFFGGFLMAQPLQSAPTAFIGGFGSGLYQFGPNDENGQLPRFGGWLFGRPDYNPFIEQHSRTLVKARSKDVVDQNLDLDSQLILFGDTNQDFNAKLGIFTTSSVDFNAKLKVDASKLLPSSFLTVTANRDSNGVTQVVATASGTLFQNGTFFTDAYLDFGEPFGFGGSFGNGGFSHPTYHGSISGFDFNYITTNNNIVSGVHDFNCPGKYVITASFTDNLGQVTMSAYSLNTLISGSLASLDRVPIEGFDYPAIEISGLPRAGFVPPVLFVDFDMRASGVNHPYVVKAVQKLNAKSPVSNSNLLWNFGNGITTTIKQPFSNYANPGLYIPVARYQYIHPSGQLVSPSGGAPSGLGPIYGSKAIWISDSLVVGFNR